MSIAQWIVIWYFSLANCAVGKCEVSFGHRLIGYTHSEELFPLVDSTRWFSTVVEIRKSEFCGFFITVSVPERNEAEQEASMRVYAAMMAYADPYAEQRKQLERDRYVAHELERIGRGLHGRSLK
jgi:hypothetical protein